MSDPRIRVRGLLLTAMDVLKEIQKIRFRLAKAMAQKLAELRSRPAVAEANGYQAYIWLPEDRTFEMRLYPPTLTGTASGWLASRPYAPSGRIMDVDWNEVYARLRPQFFYASRVLDAVKGVLSLFTDVVLEQFQIAPELYDGTLVFGDYAGWYRIEVDGIKVIYVSQYRAIDGRIEAVLIEDYLTTTHCGLRAVLKGLLSQAAEGVMIQCQDNSIVTVSHYGNECAGLDQVVTYIRQLLDKQIHCPDLQVRNVTFTSGPLEGFAWPEDPLNKIIVWDGLTSQVVDVSEIADMFKRAYDACANSIKTLACATAQPCPAGQRCVPTSDCESRGGTCMSNCPGGCCCQLPQ